MHSRHTQWQALRCSTGAPQQIGITVSSGTFAWTVLFYALGISLVLDDVDKGYLRNFPTRDKDIVEGLMMLIAPLTLVELVLWDVLERCLSAPLMMGWLALVRKLKMDPHSVYPGL